VVGGRASYFLLKLPPNKRAVTESGATLGANPKVTLDRHKPGRIWVESRMRYKLLLKEAPYQR
jgi:hypothetical protein